MDISVVIPTYNRAALISETLEAVFGQSAPADEVIVVDDGSTDETPSVLARYRGRIRLIRTVNGGELVARNVGLRAARGRLVAFCDDDDLWERDFLLALSSQWRAGRPIMACYSDLRVLRGGALSERSKFDDAPHGFWSDLRATGTDAGVFDQSIAERLFAFQPFFPSCMMVDRTAFLALGGWEERVVHSCDFATILLVALHPVGVVRRALVKIRRHEGNFSGNFERMILGTASGLEYVSANRPELAHLSATIAEGIAWRRRAALDSAFSRRDFPAVREIARLLSPKGRSIKHHMKYAIAALPPALAGFIAARVSR